MPFEPFPIIDLQGTAEERGIQHGTLLKDRIHQTIKFYKLVFKLPEKEILETAEHFTSVIESVNHDYLVELEAIAQGAEVDPRWILALNCRSEIITMVNQNPNECTALVVPNSGLLAQNWDWAEALEGLSVIMRIKYPSGHTILMMTEPGIIGKIGLNSSGVGVTLNFLHAPGKLDGVPIHILLRMVLDSRNYDEAVEKTRNYAIGKAGNIIIASGHQYIDFEFANTEFHELSANDQIPFSHTNHFLADKRLNTRGDLLASSYARYARSRQIIESNDSPSTIADIKALLKDQQNSSLPICRPYIVDAEIGNVGTICSLIMDLRSLTLYYTPGNPFTNEYRSISLSNS